MEEPKGVLQEYIDACVEEPLIGLECIEFYSYDNYKLGKNCYRCNLCFVNDLTDDLVVPHLINLTHRLGYLKKNRTDFYNKCIENIAHDTKSLSNRVYNVAKMVENTMGRKDVFFGKNVVKDIISQELNQENLGVSGTSQNWLGPLMIHCQKLLNNNAINSSQDLSYTSTNTEAKIKESAQLWANMQQRNDHVKKEIKEEEHLFQEQTLSSTTQTTFSDEATTNSTSINNILSTQIDDSKNGHHNEDPVQEFEEVLEKLPPIYRTYSNILTVPLIGMEFVTEYQRYGKLDEKLIDIFYKCNLCYPDKRLNLLEYLEKFNIPCYGEDLTQHLLSDKHKRAYLAIKNTALLKQWDRNVQRFTRPEQVKTANDELCARLLSDLREKEILAADQEGEFGKMGVSVEGINPEKLLEILIQNGCNYEELYGIPIALTQLRKSDDQLDDKCRTTDRTIYPKSADSSCLSIEEMVTEQVEIIKEIKAYLISAEQKDANEIDDKMYPGMDTPEKWKLMQNYLNSMLGALIN